MLLCPAPTERPIVSESIHQYRIGVGEVVGLLAVAFMGVGEDLAG